jgi:hypothetical protein
MALVGTVVSYGVYFWWYRYLKNRIAIIVGRQNFSNGEITIITGLAGVMSSIFSNPIWMMNTRLAIVKKEDKDSQVSALQLVKQIVDNEGVSAFFKGVIPNLILVINPIINFVVYERLKRIALKVY